MDIREVFKQEYINRCLENDEPLTGYIKELFNQCLTEVYHNSPPEMDQFLQSIVSEWQEVKDTTNEDDLKQQVEDLTKRVEELTNIINQK
ncbi:hypothetical protein [Enterococcus phage vB_Efm8_KEN21]